MTDATSSLMEFPCEFPIKVMGKHSAEFRGLVVGLVEAHTGELQADRVSSRLSGQGRYVALTITVTARSQEQLDNIYRALTECEHVLMSL